MKIAIVDDEIIDLMAAKAFISGYVTNHYPDIATNMSIDVFTAGEELLTLFCPGGYDLLVFDIELNDMDGITLAKLISREHGIWHIVNLMITQRNRRQGSAHNWNPWTH